MPATSKNYLLRKAIADGLHASADVALEGVHANGAPGEIIILRRGDLWSVVGSDLSVSSRGRCVAIAAGQGTFSPGVQQLKQETTLLLHLLVRPDARDESDDDEPIEDTLLDQLLTWLHFRTLTDVHGSNALVCQQKLRLEVVRWRELPDPDFCRRDIEVVTRFYL